MNLTEEQDQNSTSSYTIYTHIKEKNTKHLHHGESFYVVQSASTDANVIGSRYKW